MKAATRHCSGAEDGKRGTSHPTKSVGFLWPGETNLIGLGDGRGVCKYDKEYEGRSSPSETQRKGFYTATSTIAQGQQTPRGKIQKAGHTITWAGGRIPHANELSDPSPSAHAH